jgi:hypothetical protein
MISATSVFFFEGCVILTGGEIKPLQEKQAIRFLKTQNSYPVKMYRLSYDCMHDQYKSGIKRDTTNQFYPMQNVLFKGDSLISWIRLCDKNQTPYWATFPPVNPYKMDLSEEYSLSNELACITDFKGTNIDLEFSPDRYYFFIYYLKIGGLIGGPVSRTFLKKSLSGIQKYRNQYPVDVIFVNANPD